MHAVKLSATVQQLLRCPICKATIEVRDGQYQCHNPTCHALFPILNGIPILIDESSSVFSIDDFVHQRNTFFELSWNNSLKQTTRRFVRALTGNMSRNIKGKENYRKFVDLLLCHTGDPKLLVIGGSIV